jgi:hypothetical protein
MPYTILLHVAGEDAVVGEVDELPKPSDNSVVVNSPRRKDGKEITNLDQRAIKVVWPLHRINFIEIFGNEDEDQIIGFVRE